MIQKIVLIGSGNVATHLGKALKSKGVEILQIYSKTKTSAYILSEKLGCPYTNKLKDLMPGADLYILSVSDSAISKIVEKLPFDNLFLAHTSGSTDLNTIKKKKHKAAVLYPLQTLSKEVEIDFKKVPLLIESDNEKNLKEIKYLAESLSSEVYSINSRQRLIIHIAAVFACNFTNHMFAIAEDLLKKNNLEFDIIKPLIRETVRKIESISPIESQTGPAVRNDKNIIELHLQKLHSFEDYQNFYNFITKSIIFKQHMKDLDMKNTDNEEL